MSLAVPKHLTGFYEKRAVFSFFLSFFLSFFFGLFAFSRAAPATYGDSQARGLIGAVATGPRQSHSNADP